MLTILVESSFSLSLTRMVLARLLRIQVTHCTPHHLCKWAMNKTSFPALSSQNKKLRETKNLTEAAYRDHAAYIQRTQIYSILKNVKEGGWSYRHLMKEFWEEEKVSHTHHRHRRQKWERWPVKLVYKINSGRKGPWAGCERVPVFHWDNSLVHTAAAVFIWVWFALAYRE